MPNTYFKFQQFIIYQDKCAMKVCTDACILGAWAANFLAAKDIGTVKCLDIGAGTGLLSLMLAQKTNAVIDALEIDEAAFEQGRTNFQNSPWSERLRAFQMNAIHFSADLPYDFIICNPPFYENVLLSPDKHKNVARHDKGLKLDELITVIRKMLSDTGNFAILLPYHRHDYFENIALENGFNLQQKLLIKATSKHHYFRGILLFSRAKAVAAISELVIKVNESYSADFLELLKDYYLFSFADHMKEKIRKK